ncbi:MAG: segregation/condensation protein A [Planctomycetes bacterium]|nr:segregation/condensation protein A [Planctomycetota bacterium]
MPTTEYRVELDLFHGPLDLLLYLVRRNEVDILDLPIAKITAQFVEFLEVLEFLDLDLVSDFLVMASSLLEIKSCRVLPQTEEEPEEEPVSDEDSRGELIKQLLEYKKFKDAAKLLEEQAAQWQERFPRLSDERPSRGKDPTIDRIKEVELWDLVSALGRVLKRRDVTKETRIRHDETPISVYIAQITLRVRKEGRVPFSSFFEGSNRKTRIVNIFLAILELIRHQSFRADQPTEFGEIWILPPLDISNRVIDDSES